jgi:hypothetical protein
MWAEVLVWSMKLMFVQMRGIGLRERMGGWSNEYHNFFLVDWRTGAFWCWAKMLFRIGIDIWDASGVWESKDSELGGLVASWLRSALEDIL